MGLVLYRSIGRAEYDLVADSGWSVWPPRLPDQPIFYPVTTFDYAEKIARDWNSVKPAPDNLGYVTRFEISDEIAARYPVQDAGDKAHRELWVSAEELVVFNETILGKIEVVGRYRDGERIDV